METILEIFVLVMAFFAGASIGSFVGVLIDRIPRKESIIKNRSHCTNCNHQIRWFENIPVFSFLFLKGQCSSCRNKIGIKFFLIELTSGLLALIVIIPIY